MLVCISRKHWVIVGWLSLNQLWEDVMSSSLTTCGESVDWKLKSTPMVAICSSHFRLTSLLSSSYSPLLLKRRFSAFTSCSANAHSAPTRDWQNMTSRRNWSSVSVIEKYKRIHDICINICIYMRVHSHLHYTLKICYYFSICLYHIFKSQIIQTNKNICLRPNHLFKL